MFRLVAVNALSFNLLNRAIIFFNLALIVVLTYMLYHAGHVELSRPTRSLIIYLTKMQAF